MVMNIKKLDAVKSGQIGFDEYDIMWSKWCGDEDEDWSVKEDCKQAEIKTSRRIQEK